jgi:hypothetical protein
MKIKFSIVEANNNVVNLEDGTAATVESTWFTKVHKMKDSSLLRETVNLPVNLEELSITQKKTLYLKIEVIEGHSSNKVIFFNFQLLSDSNSIRQGDFTLSMQPPPVT